MNRYTGASILSLSLFGCAPLKKETRTSVVINFESRSRTLSRSGAIGISSAFTANDLPSGVCYAIHVTGAGPKLNRGGAEPLTAGCRNNFPGVGIMNGSITKGQDLSIEVPVGSARRFDFIGMPASVFGGSCPKDLRIEPSSTVGSDGLTHPDLYIGANKLPSEHMDVRVYATASDVTINPGENIVSLNLVTTADGSALGDEYGCSSGNGSGSGSGNGSGNSDYYSVFPFINVSNAGVKTISFSTPKMFFNLGCVTATGVRLTLLDSSGAISTAYPNNPMSTSCGAAGMPAGMATFQGLATPAPGNAVTARFEYLSGGSTLYSQDIIASGNTNMLLSNVFDQTQTAGTPFSKLYSSGANFIGALGSSGAWDSMLINQAGTGFHRHNTTEQSWQPSLEAGQLFDYTDYAASSSAHIRSYSSGNTVMQDLVYLKSIYFYRPLSESSGTTALSSDVNRVGVTSSNQLIFSSPVGGVRWTDDYTASTPTWYSDTGKTSSLTVGFDANESKYVAIDSAGVYSGLVGLTAASGVTTSIVAGYVGLGTFYLGTDGLTYSCDTTNRVCSLYSSQSFSGGTSIAKNNSSNVYVSDVSGTRFTSDGGATWSDVGTSPPASLRDIKTCNAWVQGYNIVSSVYIFHRFDGSSWTSYPAPSLGTGVSQINSSTCDPSDIPYVATDAGVFKYVSGAWKLAYDAMDGLTTSDTHAIYFAGSHRLFGNGSGVWTINSVPVSKQIVQASGSNLTGATFDASAQSVLVNMGNLAGDFDPVPSGASASIFRSSENFSALVGYSMDAGTRKLGSLLMNYAGGNPVSWTKIVVASPTNALDSQTWISDMKVQSPSSISGAPLATVIGLKYNYFNSGNFHNVAAYVCASRTQCSTGTLKTVFEGTSTSTPKVFEGNRVVMDVVVASDKNPELLVINHDSGTGDVTGAIYDTSASDLNDSAATFVPGSSFYPPWNTSYFVDGIKFFPGRPQTSYDHASVVLYGRDSSNYAVVYRSPDFGRHWYLIYQGTTAGHFFTDAMQFSRASTEGNPYPVGAFLLKTGVSGSAPYQILSFAGPGY